MAEVKCNECGRTFDSRGIGPHQRTKNHKGKTPVETSKALVPVNHKPVRKYVRKPKVTGKRTLMELSQFMVMTDSTGGIWLAERIR